jgi:hypothetical protein
MKAQLEEFAPDPFCSPQSIVPCHLLNQGDGLSGDLWCGRNGSGLVFPKELEALARPSQERLWLDNDEGLFPALNYPGQKSQKHPVRFGTGGSFHLSPQDDKLLTEECVFSDKLGLATGLVCQRPQQERGGVWFGPGDVAVVERLKAKTYQPLEKGENPMHSVYYPFVKIGR